VNLPQATTIGGGAFDGCVTLTTVNLPKAATIGESVFYAGGGTDITVTFGAAPPTVGKDTFQYNSSTETVTVRVPSANAGDYTADWQSGFRGKGWSSSTGIGTGTENSTITLTLATY
jgi:hypothetical protein